jgi:membrane protein
MTLRKYIRILGRSVVDFFRDGGFMLAGSLSYFSIMAVVPFCLFLVSIFMYSIGDNEELFRFFTAKIVNLFPKAAHNITGELKDAISFKGVGTFMFIVYGVLSYQLYSSLEYAMNVVFKVKEKRSFLFHLIISFFIITLLLIFILLSFAASSSIMILSSLSHDITGIELRAATAFMIKYVVPFLLVFVTTAALYVILPKKKIGWGNAMTGALFATIFQEAAKHVFTLYVVKIAKFGAIYGPLSAIVIFLLWTFYSSCIFLIGAEFVHNLESSKKRS